MIRVLQLIPTLDRSGAEKQLALLACGLPRSEFEVEVVCLTRGGPYEETLRAAGIPVTILGKRSKLDLGALRRLRRLLRERKPDVLHTWLFAANAYGRMAARGLTGTRVVVSERCVDVWKSSWQRWLDRRLAPRMDRMIANSESVAAHYRGQGVPDDKLVVIRNGVELPPHSIGEPNAATAASNAALRAELNLPETTRVVGYVGRLAQQKRVHDLIWAAQLLRQISSDVCLVVVGDGPERAALEKLATQFDCWPWLRFVGHRNDAARFFPLFRVFWLGSDFEGMPNSLMEAMAHGIPAVVSDIPPNRELCVDGQTGFVVKPGDSVGFAQFSDRILADADLATRLGAAARERMRSDFSVARMIDEHAGLYRRLVDEAG